MDELKKKLYEQDDIELMEMVRKKIYEEEERDEKLRRVIVEDGSEVEAKGKGVFIDKMKEKIKLIEEYEVFTKNVGEDVKRVFYDTYDFMLPNRIFLNDVLGDDIKRDYQIFLADKANRYLKEWLESKGITAEYEMRVREYKRFPSIYAVYSDGDEVMQFSLLRKWYGVRERGMKEQEILDRYDEKMDRLKKDEETCREKLKSAQEKRDNPLKNYPGIKNKAFILVTNKKEVYEALDKYVKSKERELVMILVEQERNRKNVKGEIERNKKRLAAQEDVEVFFGELGYELNEDKYNLY